MVHFYSVEDGQKRQRRLHSTNSQAGTLSYTLALALLTIQKQKLTYLTVKFSEGDFAKQAQLTAAQFAKSAQQASKNAQDGFNRFVEGGEGPNASRRASTVDESRRSFWDDFSSLADQRRQSQSQNSAIGTSAMGMGKNRSSGPAKPAKDKDEWDDW